MKNSLLDMIKVWLSIVVIVSALVNVGGQLSQNQYEVESVINPNRGRKDTREVNSVLVFENDGIRIRSRRSDKVFKRFLYTDIKSVDHSYSKRPELLLSRGTAVVLSLLSGMPLFLLSGKEEKHWLTVATDTDYAVLKIENDNYRLIRMEFIVRKLPISEINENKQ